MQTINPAKPGLHHVAGRRYIGANPQYQVFDDKADIPQDVRAADVQEIITGVGTYVYLCKVAKGVPFQRVSP